MVPNFHRLRYQVLVWESVLMVYRCHGQPKINPLDRKFQSHRPVLCEKNQSSVEKLCPGESAKKGALQYFLGWFTTVK